MYWTL